MSSLQAAFGRAQLVRLDELLERKRQIFDWYDERLRRRRRARSSTIEPPGSDNTYWMVTMVGRPGVRGSRPAS